MNISRTNNGVPANLQQVASRTSPSKVARDPDQDGDQHTAPTQANQGVLSQRLANLTSKVENRVQNAIDSGNLSDDQKQALQDAAASFEKLMGRIGNADFDKTPKRQVLYALHQLGSKIHDILGPLDGTGIEKSAVSGPANSPSTKNVATVTPVQIDKLA